MKKLILASPRGFCAGVTRAIEIVQKALELWGRPIYVRHQIVHNQYVVDRLREQGAIFVEELDQIPAKSRVIFSAHGVPPRIFEQARKLDLEIIDATCPLVTKVHKEAKNYESQNRHIILIGHKNHVETIGTSGVVPQSTTVVESVEDIKNLSLSRTTPVGILTQTTLSVLDTKEIEAEIRKQFSDILSPSRSDICFATTNRQTAIQSICTMVELVLVVGSRSSSNSNRLQEVAQKAGVPAYLINDESEIDPKWLEKVKTLGMTAGASTPEDIIFRCIEKLRELGVCHVEEKIHIEEKVSFQLPIMKAKGQR